MSLQSSRHLLKRKVVHVNLKRAPTNNKLTLTKVILSLLIAHSILVVLICLIAEWTSISFGRATLNRSGSVLILTLDIPCSAVIQGIVWMTNLV